jgi:PAS domain-containing protein
MAMDDQDLQFDRRFATLVADSPIAAVISNPRLPDNPIVACNATFCELTAYAPAEVIGRNCRFLAGPATEPWLWPAQQADRCRTRARRKDRQDAPRDPDGAAGA